MRAKAFIVIGMALMLAGAAAAREARSIAFRASPGTTESFTVQHQTRYARAEGMVDGPGVSYRLSVTVLSRLGDGYRARVTIGTVVRAPAVVPGVDLDAALAHSLDGLTFEVRLDSAGRPVAIEDWREFRLELTARAMFALTGDASGELVAMTTQRLIRSLDAAQAAELIARPLAVMAEVRDLAYEPSPLRVDLRLSARSGATLVPGPFEWDVSFEPIPVGGQIYVRWQARPAHGTDEHRENGTGVYRDDGWPTRLSWSATTLSDGDLTERSLTVIMLAGAGR